MHAPDKGSCAAAAVIAVLLTAAPVLAQKKSSGPPKPPPKVELKFDREVFTYPAGARRDPFTPLVGQNEAGPLFEELSLRGVVYSSDPASSIALVGDGTKVYRVHRGERVGNARVVAIRPNRVVFDVDNFGVVRQESLELKRQSEGANG